MTTTQEIIYVEADGQGGGNNRRNPEANAAATRRPRLSLRVVISVLTAIIVLIVAAATFAITYSQGLASSESLGKDFGRTLLTAALGNLETTFNGVTSVFTGLQQQMRMPGMMLSRDDPTMFTLLERTRELVISSVLPIIDIVSGISLLFDDGSNVQLRVTSNASMGTVLWTYMGNVRGVPAGQTCCQTFRMEEFVLGSMRPVPTSIERIPYDDTSKIGAYVGARPVVMALPSGGLWQPPLYVDVATPPANALPIITPLRNNTHFLGMGFGIVSLETFQSTLAALKGTAGSRFYAIHTASASVVATNYPAPFLTYRAVTSLAEAANPPEHCATSLPVARPSATEWNFACRAKLAEYADPALRAAASDPQLVRPTAQDGLVFRTMTAGGKSYYVTAAAISNPYRAFGISLLLVIPVNDILGKVYDARNIAIGVVVGICVLACAFAFAATAVVLRPLETVSGHMMRTARLREVSANDAAPVSHLREVHDLQTAYSGMNTAIQSFTRYVPRDVVKDLLASGQLCRIAMEPTPCSMLFTDIAGFTSMCERVPHTELSEIVREFFDVMSAIVMRHGGIIDKFIGDCIMAVWGAPVPIGNQELRATLCATVMEHATRGERLSASFDRAGEQLSIRVGVASGSVLAGNMGSAERMSYTVIGDDVNLAARLEALNKQFGTHVMVSEGTVKRLPPNVFCLRLLHRIQVVGKDEAVTVHEVVGIRERATAMHGDTMQALRDGDRHHAVDDSASEVGSTQSSAHHYQRHEDRAVAHTASRLLEDAYESTPSPVVDAAQCHRIETLSAAVTAYFNRRIPEAIALFAQASGGNDDSLDVAARLVLRECHRIVQEGATDFVTAWRATEK